MVIGNILLYLRKEYQRAAFKIIINTVYYKKIPSHPPANNH